MAFCEKPPKLVDLFKTSNVLCQLPCFSVSDKFLEKTLTLCEKRPKFVDLFQTSKVLCKLPCFRVLVKFLEKSCKNYGILWKTTKTC